MSAPDIKIIFAVLFVGFWFAPSRANAQSPDVFNRTGNMTAPRVGHTATLLPDGKVLVAGGYTRSPSGSVVTITAELYDPATGAWSFTGSLNVARSYASASLLTNGKVLVAGGYTSATYFGHLSTGVTNTAELYDPATGAWSLTGNLNTSRAGHPATTLRDGRVLIAGGWNGSSSLDTAELYEPASEKWSTTGSLNTRRFYHTLTPLSSGNVLAAGGTEDGNFFNWTSCTWPCLPESLASAELYDPNTGSWSVTGGLNVGRDGHTATVLPNGNVLTAAGYPCPGVCSGASVNNNSAELFNPVTGTWSNTGNLDRPRQDHTATVLPEGRILVVGGWDTGKWDDDYYSLSSAEIYDPASGNWNRTANLNEPRSGHTATLLNDGTVLIAGGSSYGGVGVFYGGTASAELYTPTVLIPAPVLLSVSGDGQGQGFILHNLTGRITSPDDPAAAEEIVQIYSVGLSDGSAVPPQVSIGGRMAEILSFGNAPGWAGVNQINVRVPNGVASASVVPVRLTYLGRTSNEVTIAVQ